MVKKVSIFGASGFVGKHLVHKLLQNKVFEEVKLFSRHPISLQYPVSGMLHTVIGDLLDKNTLKLAIEAGDTVINLTYLSQNPNDNATALRNLAEISAEKKIARLIHCSTASVYGNISHPLLNEKTPCNPSSSYERSKLLLENLLINDFSNNFEIALLRPTQIFGAYGKNLIKQADEISTGNSFKNYLKSCLLSKRYLNLVGVENVVSAIICLAEAQQLQENIYLLSDDGEIPLTYLDVEKKLGALLGAKKRTFPIIQFPLWIYKTLYRGFRQKKINPTQIYRGENLSKLGYRPEISLDDALAKFASWYKTERENENP